MNKYTIYCTEEQTRKALELGAPIELWKDSDDIVHPNYIKLNIQDNMGLCSRGYTYAVIPTVEQMIGWLRTKNIHIVITKDAIDDWSAYGHEIEPIEFTAFNRLTGYSSFEEATLAAIDAALEYLTKNKK